MAWKRFVRPVEVPSGAFAFCRWSLALALWGALLAGRPWLVALTGLVLAASALAGVGRSPLIVLWSQTGHRLLWTEDVLLDANAMRFAHGAGAVLCGLVYAALVAAPRAGFVALIALVALKTIGACGFCTASKLYECAAQEGCCRLSRRHGD